MRYIKFFVIVVFVVFSAAVAFSAGSGENEDSGVRVAYVINGALGDQSFFDSGYGGIERIENDFDVKTTTIEINYDPAKYSQALDSAVRWDADVIFVIAYGFEDLVRLYADDNPQIVFVNIDTVINNSKNTIINIDFIEEEGAFMAGAAAALLTTDLSIPGINEDKIIGSVGGEDDPVINAFIFGYEQGAAFIDPDIVVDNIYAGTWSDPVRGKQAANQLFGRGSDVIFQIAALTGNGVLEAAKDANLYAIGVDSNQNGQQPGHVVTSDLKNVGDAIYDVFLSIINDQHRLGETLSYGLAEGGVGLAIDEHTRAILPEASIARLMEIEKQIIDGEIVVPLFQ